MESFLNLQGAVSAKDDAFMCSFFFFRYCSPALCPQALLIAETDKHDDCASERPWLELASANRYHHVQDLMEKE